MVLSITSLTQLPVRSWRFSTIKALSCTLALLLTTACAGYASNPLKNTEICNGIYGNWNNTTLEQTRDMPLTMLSHPSVSSIAMAHNLGTRVLTYCTFYQAPPNAVYQNALASEHPDWVCVQPNGTFGISVFAHTNESSWVTMCPNSFGYRSYVLKLVKFLMDQGADGLFIDNAHPDIVCEGPRFGMHQHIYPGQGNIYAYRKLLEEVQALVKSYGQDKAIVVNPGAPQDSWTGVCDGQMLESYICSWDWNNRWTEDKILDYQKQWGVSSETDAPIIALSYLGFTRNAIRDDAFYTYAWAKLSGFIWADWFTGKTAASDLYKVRTGQPTGPMQTLNGYYLREFTGGLVVTTSQSKGATFRLDAIDHPTVTDVYTGKLLRSNRSGYYEITLKSGQGRVYTYPSELKVASNHRTKVNRSLAPHRSILAFY